MTCSGSGTAIRPSIAWPQRLDSKHFSTAALLLILFTALSPLAARGQSYVYVNNQDVANTVVAFSVSSSGSLTPVPGSPFATGGAGSTLSCYGLDRIVVSSA